VLFFFAQGTNEGINAFSQILWPGEIGYVQAFIDGTLALSMASWSTPFVKML
jgi:hypothetical protein